MSEHNSVAELASILSKKLQKPKFPSPRNNTLRERLDSSFFPQTPSNPQDALSFSEYCFAKFRMLKNHSEENHSRYQFRIFF